jgi:hypothetical protein
MKNRSHHIFFVLLATTQITQCGLDEAFAKLQQNFDKKVEQANDKLQAKLDASFDRGFTNATIKFAGLSLTYLALSRFLIPELVSYYDRSKSSEKDKATTPYVCNQNKLITGALGSLAGLCLMLGGDRLTNYWYPKSA